MSHAESILELQAMRAQALETSCLRFGFQELIVDCEANDAYIRLELTDLARRLGLLLTGEPIVCRTGEGHWTIESVVSR